MDSEVRGLFQWTRTCAVRSNGLGGARSVRAAPERPLELRDSGATAQSRRPSESRPSRQVRRAAREDSVSERAAGQTRPRIPSSLAAVNLSRDSTRVGPRPWGSPDGLGRPRTRQHTRRSGSRLRRACLCASASVRLAPAVEAPYAWQLRRAQAAQIDVMINCLVALEREAWRIEIM